MSGEGNMLTLEVLFNTSLENEQHMEETGCTSCMDFHQEHSNIDIVKTICKTEEKSVNKSVRLFFIQYFVMKYILQKRVDQI